MARPESATAAGAAAPAGGAGADPDPNPFLARHLGPGPAERTAMLELLGLASLEELADRAVPAAIRHRAPLALPAPADEAVALAELAAIAGRNRVLRSLIGQGYHGTFLPPVIRRNILENPGWYTAYTPYQAEISQGRLEALLNFQTMVCDLTAMEIANASLLDEGTAAAEAMAMAFARRQRPAADEILVAAGCHPQTIAVVNTRAAPLGIRVTVRPDPGFAPGERTFAALLQYPRTDGTLFDLEPAIARAHGAAATTIVATDPLALVLVRPPGEAGADIVVGSTQRFGLPPGAGGPHAAFLATREKFRRDLPGRLVGVSRDARGRPAYRLALQTREQHIRREKATSNICTAQVLPAVIAAMYAVYHGPRGLRDIARRIHDLTARVAAALRAAGWELAAAPFFDTLRIATGDRTAAILAAARDRGFNLRQIDPATLGATFDETCTGADLAALLPAFGIAPEEAAAAVAPAGPPVLGAFARTSPALAHPVFDRFHTETEMLRYLRRLEAKDLSLAQAMIPLGSCTMKLNATAELLPISWPALADLHPFAPPEQLAGYRELATQLERWLAAITGFAAVSLQPNAGAQGEYAGLLAIRAWHASRGDIARDLCLIPTSAHGTNPASAVMAGCKVVPVKCRDDGDIDLDDLRARAAAAGPRLAAAMITYPSTHGVFEEGIVDVCRAIHERGGQVYMDGANLNAQVGLCRPADIGADVCHLNLHKTFCIPHGGGGPGVGPIGVAPHLAPFLPAPHGTGAVGPVAAAPLGSALLLAIPWMYIRMMGAAGLTAATTVAILNANYVARRLGPFFPVLYRGPTGLVAHECILDLRGFTAVTAEDVAKRLMDYGFHAPTLSWPVPGTLMVEPTESEGKGELDRFCDAMIAIRAEIAAVESGAIDPRNNPLKNAPHPAEVVAADRWDRPYGREQAAYPAPWLRDFKFWPAVGRIDNVWGDRNPVCVCPPVASY